MVRICLLFRRFEIVVDFVQFLDAKRELAAFDFYVQGRREE